MSYKYQDKVEKQKCFEQMQKKTLTFKIDGNQTEAHRAKAKRQMV